MLKTLKIATILTGVSAFALPAFAQTSDTIVPGNEAQIEENDATVRTNVAEESDVNLSQPDAPVASQTSETIVPGSEALIEENEAQVRNEVAEGTSLETTGEMAGEGDDQLVPGSGATFSPRTAPEGQQAVEQDEAVTTN